MTSTQLAVPIGNPSQRAFLAVEQLKASIEELYDLSKLDPLSVTPHLAALEEMDVQLSLLRPRVKLSKSLIHLSSEFGRAP